MVYHRSQTFPNNRSVLYRKSLRLFLEEWAAERRIMREAIYEGLSTQYQEILLSEIAHAYFDADQLFFDKREVVDTIKTFLQDNLNAPKHLAGEKILNAIAIQQGILVERAEDVFSFSHLTLQEYLIEQYIVDNCQIDKLVNNCLTDRRWDEVFPLTAGLMRGGADDLLLMMEAQAQSYIKSPKLASVVEKSYLRGLVHAVNPNISHIIDNTRTPYEPSNTTRAFSHALSRVIVEELDNFQIFSNINFKSIVERLKKLKSNNEIPLRIELNRVHEGFIYRVSVIWFNNLTLNSKLVHLPDEESQSLENFIYINSLMVRCKQSAVRVSTKTWLEIENRMLLV